MEKRLANALNCSVCIISAVRLKEILSIDQSDFPFSSPIALLFSTLEPCLLVVAACIPLLRPLLREGSVSSSDPGYGSRLQRPQKPASGFNQLQDDASTRELRTTNSAYGVSVSTKDEELADRDNVELTAITIKQDWKVEDASANSRR